MITVRMPEDGVARIDALVERGAYPTLRSIDKEFFIHPICALGPERMAKVCRALDHATGRR